MKASTSAIQWKFHQTGVKRGIPVLKNMRDQYCTLVYKSMLRQRLLQMKFEKELKRYLIYPTK